MCLLECFGNYYRGCNHFILSYYSGEKKDCGSPTCRLSVAHMHKTATNCRCIQQGKDDRRILNMFQQPCDACREAEFVRRVR